MEDKIETLAQTEHELKKQIADLKVELERNAKRSQENILALKKQHMEEVDFLKRSNLQLKVFLVIVH